MSGKSFHKLKSNEDVVGGVETFEGQCDEGDSHYFLQHKN